MSEHKDKIHIDRYRRRLPRAGDNQDSFVKDLSNHGLLLLRYRLPGFLRPRYRVVTARGKIDVSPRVEGKERIERWWKRAKPYFRTLEEMERK